MSSQDQIDICVFKASPTVQDYLLETLNISKSQIKKQGLSKKFLTKTLKERDVISVSLNLVNHGLINPVYNGKLPKILFEDENIIALSKPAGVHCHPLTYLEHDNLVSFLQSQGLCEPLKVNTNAFDRGLMYRLDFDTSGLVVFIKKEKLYRKVREDFKEIVDKKIYYAVVSGLYDGDSDVQTLLKPSGVKGKKIVEDTQLNADTKFSRLKIIDTQYSQKLNSTLLKIELFEGHRHQIRAQLRANNFPIKGDRTYGGVKADRLYLHCFQYQFNLGGIDYDLKDESADFLSEFFDLNR